MCYFNELTIKEKTIRVLANQVQTDPINIPLRSGFDFTDYPIIKPESGRLKIVNAHWEFLPGWCKNWDEVKQSRQKYTTLNAQGEKLLESKLYHGAATNGRCLVLSSGFYEWRHYKPEGSKKEIAYPYHITMPGHEYFYMAGISQPWTDKSTGETIDTFAIVTTAANRLMEQVHNKKKRMPVILPEELANIWLFAELKEADIQLLATHAIDSALLKAETVSKDFKISSTPAAPYHYQELPNLV